MRSLHQNNIWGNDWILRIHVFQEVTQCQPVDGHWCFEDTMVPWNTSNSLLMDLAFTTHKTWIFSNTLWQYQQHIQIEHLLIYEIWGFTVMIIERIVFWGVILCSLVGYQCVSQTLLTGTHMQQLPVTHYCDTQCQMCFKWDVVNKSWEMLLCVVLYPVVGHRNMSPLMHTGCVRYMNVVPFLLAIMCS